MPRGRHASRHSQSNGASVRSRKYIGIKAYSWFALGAAFSVLLGMTVRHVTSTYEGAAVLSPASCPATPRLAADSATATLLGAAASNPTTLAQFTAQFGHMPIIRVFYPGLPSPKAWTTGSPAINKSAVVVSFNAQPAAILSGADDATLSHFFDTAPTGHPIYYSYYHEPEVHIQLGQFTLSAYRAAWAHVVSLADAAHNPDLKSTLILTSWDLSPQSGRNWKDYLPGGGIISTLGWDDYPPGTVEDHDPQATPPADFMSAEVAAAKSVGLPFGFAEFALATQTDRPEWLKEVASYLQSSGALFGTLFDSAGFPSTVIHDAASIQTWRSAVADSALGTPVANPSTSPSPPAPTIAPAPTPTIPIGKPTPVPAVTPTGLVITKAAVRPATFAPTGANHARILFKLSQEADITVCVLNSRGTTVRQLGRRDQPAGSPSYWYFGHDGRGRLLPAGRYPVLIVARNAQGTATAQTVLTITSPPAPGVPGLF